MSIISFSINIRRMKVYDLYEIIQLQPDYFSTLDDPIQHLKQRIRSYPDLMCVMEYDHIIIGFIIGKLYTEHTNRNAYIDIVHISEAYRRRGFGKMLVEVWERNVLQRGINIMNAIVLADVAPIIHFFQVLKYDMFTYYNVSGYYVYRMTKIINTLSGPIDSYPSKFTTFIHYAR